MFLEKLRARASDESGFTLVELLVVMLIIGILAAIAIPSFFNQRDKARDADAKSAARTAQTAIETYATDNNGAYAGADVADLVEIEPTLADRVITVESAANTYTVTAKHANRDVTFSINRLADATTTLTCSAAGKDGGCNAGSW